jgi:GGDEF domain-containing protein
MNGKAFMDVLIDYASDYNENGTDYALIILRNTRHDRVISDYGKEFADKVLKRMSEEILKSTAGSIVAARVTNSDFAMLSYTTKQSELDMLTEKIKTAVNSIKEIDGNKLTLKVSIAAIARSDKESTDENMYQKLLDRMKEQA